MTEGLPCRLGIPCSSKRHLKRICSGTHRKTTCSHPTTRSLIRHRECNSVADQLLRRALNSSNNLQVHQYLSPSLYLHTKSRIAYSHLSMTVDQCLPPPGVPWNRLGQTEGSRLKQVDHGHTRLTLLHCNERKRQRC